MSRSLARAFLGTAISLSPLVASKNLINLKVAASLDIGPVFETVLPGSTSPEAFQLTDAVLSNLTSLDLGNITLFRFDDGSQPGTSRCKAFPGESAWPTTETWNTLNVLTGGKLITTVPIGAVCYQGGALRCC
ncbi:FAD-binding domain-containing protein [Apiospora arundinis]